MVRLGSSPGGPSLQYDHRNWSPQYRLRFTASSGTSAARPSATARDGLTPHAGHVASPESALRAWHPVFILYVAVAWPLRFLWSRTWKRSVRTLQCRPPVLIHQPLAARVCTRFLLRETRRDVLRREHPIEASDNLGNLASQGLRPRVIEFGARPEPGKVILKSIGPSTIGEHCNFVNRLMQSVHLIRHGRQTMFGLLMVHEIAPLLHMFWILRGMKSTNAFARFGKAADSGRMRTRYWHPKCG
jgi:hypothetical protein